MMGKTHIAVGIAAAYLITQPQTAPEFIIATVGGSIGGVMADIDVKIDTSNKYAAKASMDALYGEILAAAISVGALAGDYFTGGNILQGAVANLTRFIIGAVLFIVFTIIGERSKHRDKTHSLLAMLLFSASVYLMESRIGFAYLVGYGSHLLVDTFNKSPIRVLYPLKKGVCLKLCYADRLGNELLLVGSVLIMVLYIFLHTLL